MSASSGPRVWAAGAAAAATLAAALTLGVVRMAQRHYERAFAFRIAHTTAAYIAAVTPPPPPPPPAPPPRRRPPTRVRGRKTPRPAPPPPAPPPPPVSETPFSRSYDLPTLLTQALALRTLPGWSSDVEVYFGTAPLIDATTPPLSPDDLPRLGTAVAPGGAGGLWRGGTALVPLKDREGQEVVGAIAVRPHPMPHGPLPGGFGFAFPAALIAVAAAGVIAAGEPAESAARRVRVDGERRAVVAVLIGSQRRIELRSVPAEIEAPRWLIGLLPAVLLGPLAIMGLRWAERTPVRRRRETAIAWGFLSPVALHLLLFTLGPAVYALYLASLAPVRTLVRDGLTWNAFLDSATYALYVPVSIALALGAALAVHGQRSHWSGRLLRSALLLPYVASVVAIAILW